MILQKKNISMHYKYMSGYGHPTGTEAVKKFNEENSGSAGMPEKMKKENKD
jgi:hypothetical protein